MKRVRVIAMLAMVVWCGCGPDDPLSHLDSAVVVKIRDGDTIELEDGRAVRYIGIDTPETGAPGADSATALNTALVMGKRIRLEYGNERTDRYGRTLAWVFIDGRMVNIEILKAGWAWCFIFRNNMKYSDQMVLALRRAMEDDRGLWKMAGGSDGSMEYVGSFAGFRFHEPACRSAAKINPENRMIFPARDSAIYRGYAPCKVCRP